MLEGGPGLNHALISRQLVDELFLTVAPELLGGTAAQTLPCSEVPRSRPATVPSSNYCPSMWRRVSCSCATR